MFTKKSKRYFILYIWKRGKIMSIENGENKAQVNNWERILSIFENIGYSAIYADTELNILKITHNANSDADVVFDEVYIGKKVYDIPGFEIFGKYVSALGMHGNSDMIVDKKISLKDKIYDVKIVQNIIDGIVNGVFVFCIDITKYESALKQIEQDKQSLGMLAEFTNSIVWEINNGSEDVTIIKGMGIFPDGYVIKHYYEAMTERKIVFDEDLFMFENLYQCIQNAEKKFLYEMRMILYSNDYQWVRVEAKSIFAEDGKPLKIIGKLDDINDEKRNSLKLLEKSQKDPLTALYNKEVTGNLITYNIITHSGVGTLYVIDIDKFKNINDKLGHLFGDSVIREVSGRIRKIFNENDIVGRIGGDEFVVFTPGINDTSEVKQKAEMLNEYMRKSYEGNSGIYSISGSIGIAIAPRDGESYEDLFLRADAALYNTKNNGRDGYTIFDDTIEIISSDKAGRETKEILETSLKDNIEPVIGEIVDVFTNTPDVEASMKHVLYLIGEYYNLSRIYVYIYEKDTYRRAYEWLAGDNFSDNGAMQSYRYKNNDEYKERFNAQGQFYNKADEERRYETFINGAKSYFQHAMIIEGKYIGYIAFDDMLKEREWSVLERDTLSVASNLIAMIINNMKSKLMIEKETLTLKAISGNQNLYAYMLKPGTYELVYLSERLYSLIGEEARDKTICYEKFKNRKEPCEYCPLNTDNFVGDKKTIEYYNEKTKTWFRATSNNTKIASTDVSLVCFTDVTEFVDIVMQTDKLTGLLSFHGFKSLIAQRRKEITGKYMLLYINISKFKNINSTYGYECGDMILKVMSGCVTELLKEGESICRVAEDKFVVLINKAEETVINDRLGRMEDFINMRIQQRIGKMSVKLLYGVYEIVDDTTEISAMVDYANMALKTIKSDAIKRIVWYDKEMQEENYRIKKIEDRMDQALEDKEFVVYYQGKVSLDNEKISGAEALIRWKGKDGKLIPPNSFIPLFEKNGFIIKLDFYVYETVIRQIREWMDRGIDVKPVSVNVSRVHIKDDKFVTKLMEIIDRYNVPTKLIELELTENIFMEDFDEILEMIKVIKQKGFIFSIDDFGAGFSSLNLIKNLPVDVIKIDKNFFEDGENVERERVILKHIIDMANELGVKIIAEGIETSEQVEFLRKQGCQMVQGYYYFKPLPVEEFEKYLV